MNKPIVHVVDDDPGVRDSLSVLLQSAGLTSKSYASAKEFLASFKDGAPGCVIVDYRMPNMTGLEMHNRLRQTGFRIPVIVISAYGDIPTAVEAVTSGALTFLEKPFKDSTLLSWVRSAIDSDHQLREQQEERLHIEKRFNQLTSREREVLDRVISGKSSREIGDELDLSHRTIEVHRANIMRKLNVASLAELVRTTIEINRDDSESK